MKKPLFEADFELSGQTKNFYTFMMKDRKNPPDFHPTKIYIKQDFCKVISGRDIKLTITEKEK